MKTYESFFYNTLPHFFLNLMSHYFRVEIQGLENIPHKGPVIFAPNHSGFLGLDAMLLNHILQTKGQRKVKIMSHRFWFLTEALSIPAHRLGFEEATYKNGISLLKKKKAIVLFPEGEIGNFKSSTQKYQLQEFKRGFMRMALETQSPIVPTLILGAEESQINLKQIKLTKFLKGTILPLPLNLIPFPTKWKIIFLPPVDFPFTSDQVNNVDLVHDLTVEFQEEMQIALSKAAKAHNRSRRKI